MSFQFEGNVNERYLTRSSLSGSSLRSTERVIGSPRRDRPKSGSSRVQERDGADEAGRAFLDLVWEARDPEAVGGKLVEVGQFLHLPVADVAACLMAFPDDPGVPAVGKPLAGERERRIPAPSVGADNPDAPLKQAKCRLAPHAAAGVDVARLPVPCARRGIDDDDFERLDRVTDASSSSSTSLAVAT